MILRRVIAAMMMGSTVAGCYSVKRVAAPVAFIQKEQPENIWVAAENGEIFRLSGPSLQSDSVVGTINGTTEPIVLALSGNNDVFARQFDPLKTASFIGGLGLVAGLAVVGYAMGGSGPSICPEPGRRGCPYPS